MCLGRHWSPADPLSYAATDTSTPPDPLPYTTVDTVLSCRPSILCTADTNVSCIYIIMYHIKFQCHPDHPHCATPHTGVCCWPFTLCHNILMSSADHFPYATKEWCFQQTLHLTRQWSLVAPADSLPLCHSRDLTSRKLYMVFHDERTGSWHSYLSHHCSSTLYSTIVEYVGWSRLVRSSVAASLRTCRIPSRNRAATTLATTTMSA